MRGSNIVGRVSSNLIAFGDAVSAGEVPWAGEPFDATHRRAIPKAFSEIDQTLQQFSDIEGWSKRSFFVSPLPRQVFDLSFRGQVVWLVTSSNEVEERIDLERAGQPIERLKSALQV